MWRSCSCVHCFRFRNYPMYFGEKNYMSDTWLFKICCMNFILEIKVYLKAGEFDVQVTVHRDKFL